MVKNIITEKKSVLDLIHDLRYKLADLKKQKAEMKAPLWEEAQGTVDAKKDYIKSKIAGIQKEIDGVEADIEYWYNYLKILDDKLEYYD